MMCTVVMSLLLSLQGGPFECRMKNFDRDTALQYVASFRNPEFQAMMKSQNVEITNVKFQVYETPFNCDTKVIPDDSHNGCINSTNQVPKSGRATASSN